MASDHLWTDRWLRRTPTRLSHHIYFCCVETPYCFRQRIIEATYCVVKPNWVHHQVFNSILCCDVKLSSSPSLQFYRLCCDATFLSSKRHQISLVVSRRHIGFTKQVLQQCFLCWARHPQPWIVLKRPVIVTSFASTLSYTLILISSLGDFRGNLVNSVVTSGPWSCPKHCLQVILLSLSPRLQGNLMNCVFISGPRRYRGSVGGTTSMYPACP